MRSLWNRLPNVLQGALYGFSIAKVSGAGTASAGLPGYTSLDEDTK